MSLLMDSVVAPTVLLESYHCLGSVSWVRERVILGQ